MTPDVFSTLKSLSFSIVFLGMASAPAFCAGQPVIDENFDAALAPESWKIIPKGTVNTVEGQLVMSAENANESAYAVTLATTATPSEQLNFLKNKVTITMNDFTMSGTAKPKEQIFLLSLFNDNPNGMQASSVLKLRVSGDGNLILAVQQHGAPAQILWQTTISLPIKKAVLVLSPEGIKITLADQNGEQEQEVAWTSVPEGWLEASPYLNLETHRNPAEGKVEATLGSLLVESEPAATQK